MKCFEVGLSGRKISLLFISMTLSTACSKFRTGQESGRQLDSQGQLASEHNPGSSSGGTGQNPGGSGGTGPNTGANLTPSPSPQVSPPSSGSTPSPSPSSTPQPSQGQTPSPSPASTGGGSSSCPEGYQWASDVGCVPVVQPPPNMSSLPWVDASDLAQPSSLYPLFEDTPYGSTSTGDCGPGVTRVHTLRLVNSVVRKCTVNSSGQLANCGPYKRFRVQRFGPVNDYVCKTGSQFTVKTMSGQSYTASLGYGDDQPVPADLDGDGFTDLGIYRVSEGAFYFYKGNNSFRNSDMSVIGGMAATREGSSNIWKVRFGQPGDYPVLSHDGKDPASGNLGKLLLGVTGHRPGNLAGGPYYMPVYTAQKCSTVPVYEFNPEFAGYNASAKVGVNDWRTIEVPETPTDDTKYCRRDYIKF